MTDEPEQREIGINLPLHHRLQIEFDERLPREHLVVAQNSQAQPVRDESPQVRLGAIQQNLHETVWAVARRARDTRSTLVEINAKTNEVNRRVLPSVRNGVRVARD